MNTKMIILDNSQFNLKVFLISEFILLALNTTRLILS